MRKNDCLCRFSIYFGSVAEKKHKLKFGTSVVFTQLCRFWIYFFALGRMCHTTIFQTSFVYKTELEVMN